MWSSDYPYRVVIWNLETGLVFDIWHAETAKQLFSLWKYAINEAKRSGVQTFTTFTKNSKLI